MDVSHTIVAKSDQLNADDLIGGPIVVQVQDVREGPSTDQPIEVVISGAHRPWRPSKTSRRVLVAGWGKEAREWVGRWVELYRDPTVKWAGKEVGGVRIRSMSHLDRPLALALAERRGQKTQRTISVLQPPQAPSMDEALEALSLPVEQVDAWLSSKGKPVSADMPADEVAKFAAWVLSHPDQARATISQTPAGSPASSTGVPEQSPRAGESDGGSSEVDRG